MGVLYTESIHGPFILPVTGLASFCRMAPVGPALCGAMLESSVASHIAQLREHVEGLLPPFPITGGGHSQALTWTRGRATKSSANPICHSPTIPMHEPRYNARVLKVLDCLNGGVE